MFRKRLFPLFLLIVCISVLLAACTININVGNPAEDAIKETDNKTTFEDLFNSGKQKTMYESRASIYISNTIASTNDAPVISSSDLKVSKQLVESYIVILQTNKLQNQIREEYPNAEYTLSLEPINETEVFALVATGENPEQLEEICNMAVSLLCEEIPQIIEGSSCKIVDYAKSTQEVGTN